MKVYKKEFTSEEIEVVINFLNQDYKFNGLFIGDLYETGITSNHIKVVGEMENEVIKALMLFYKDKIVYSSNEDRDISVFINDINESGVTKFVGRKNLIEKFKEFFNTEFESDSYIMSMDSLKNNNDNFIKYTKKIHTKEELYKLFNLLIQVEEYSYIGNDHENFVNQQILLLESSQSRTYYLEKNGEMISTAATLGEKEKTALLVGVATHPSHRKKGMLLKLF